VAPHASPNAFAETLRVNLTGTLCVAADPQLPHALDACHKRGMFPEQDPGEGVKFV
jgi:hypothetical protein